MLLKKVRGLVSQARIRVNWECNEHTHSSKEFTTGLPGSASQLSALAEWSFLRKQESYETLRLSAKYITTNTREVLSKK